MPDWEAAALRRFPPSRACGPLRRTGARRYGPPAPCRSRDRSVAQGESSILGSDPRVLVVAETDERIGALCRGLDSLGWRTMTARSGAGAVAALTDFNLEAAVLDADHREIAALPEALRRAAGARRLPIIALAGGVGESAAPIAGALPVGGVRLGPGHGVGHGYLASRSRLRSAISLTLAPLPKSSSMTTALRSFSK